MIAYAITQQYDETSYTDLVNPDQNLSGAGFVLTGVSTPSGWAIWVRNGNLGTVVIPDATIIDAIERSLSRVTRGATPGLWDIQRFRTWYQAHPDTVVFAAHL